MTNEFNLQQIINKYNLDVKFIAEELFPANKYAKLALNRVLSGETFLDTNQLSRLALILNTNVENLFKDSVSWDITGMPNKIVFTLNNFRVELDTENWMTKLFDKNSIVHTELLHNKSIQIKDYLDHINKLINKYK